MNPVAYSAILYSLAEGIHPLTGDALPERMIDQPDVIRALFAGARALESGQPDDLPSPKPGRENAGKPWSEEDDKSLLEQHAAGLSTSKIARTLKRSEFAIQVRLDKLESAPSAAYKRQAIQNNFRSLRGGSHRETQSDAGSPPLAR